ncbi:MAG TPA: hypothetical protein PLD77_01530 [Candidatus Dojkabacteria bacterium]|nr:hypothetical protein [Candidatus Dojkabacteria bacterium]
MRNRKFIIIVTVSLLTIATIFILVVRLKTINERVSTDPYLTDINTDTSEIGGTREEEEESINNNPEDDVQEQSTPENETSTQSITESVKEPNTKQLKILKDVGEAYMDYFGLTETDFKLMMNSGVDLIEGNFDICATDEDMEYFLNMSSKYNIKVIMPAGSGEAEWSYKCDVDNYPSSQKPIWDKESVVAWINKWKNYSAVFAWDISNEAGSVFPNPSDANMLTVDQLKQAYTDVKNADPNHPVMIRMNGWYFYDYESDFFRAGNPFANNTTDIVMVNAYSNVDEYFQDFVSTVSTRSISAIRNLDSNTKIIIALGTWKEPPLWMMLTVDNLKSEITWVNNQSNIMGIAYFKYGAKDSEWYLPTNAPKLLEIISNYP